MYTKIGCVAVGGVFDGLHLGHIKLLQYTAQLAKDLDVPGVVLLNSAKSLQLLERETQHTEEQRKLLVQNVAPSLVPSFFVQVTAGQALESLRDEWKGLVLFVKGSDHRPDELHKIKTPYEARIDGVSLVYFPIEVGTKHAKLGTRG
jgi:cytidyltransferase-like protein